MTQCISVTSTRYGCIGHLVCYRYYDEYSRPLLVILNLQETVQSAHAQSVSLFLWKGVEGESKTEILRDLSLDY